MLYNKNELPEMAYTAGKITVLTALAGVVVFVMAFLFDAGSQQIGKTVSAQNATTTLTVLNTPPSFTVNPYETVESSTSSPTNSGDVITWEAIANDSNGAPYFLLVCSTANEPVPGAAADIGSLGTAPPSCSPTSTIQWGVSAATASDVLTSVSTTTSEASGSLFTEVQNWYAWVCDDDPVNPRCNITPEQGDYATSSSPFNMNNRPVFDTFTNSLNADPGGTITFSSVSTDPDVVGGEDDIFLVVCQSAGGIDPVTRTCLSTDDLASTTTGVTANASASYTLALIMQDDTYPAFGYIVDQHGHLAATTTPQANFDVNNVAPVVLGGDIDLNGGTDITLTVEADETLGFTLDFTVRDANSCENVAAAPEIVGYNVAVLRSGVGTTTCDTTAGSYNPNRCYPSGVATTTWNLNCSQVGGSCTGATDDTVDYTCTFPLWFVADPTDGSTAPYTAENWTAAVAGVDDDAAAGLLTVTSSPVELISFTAIDLITAEIPYGALEPGDDSGTLNATTTIFAVGNTGVDQGVDGDSMCGTYTVSTPCPVSASSTIPVYQQRFSSTSLAYGSALADILFSTSTTEVELDVAKTTSTSTPSEGVTYWGIAVPISITLAGSYQGLNTFYAATDEFWQ